MSTSQGTTLQRLAPEIIDVLAEDVRVLNDRASELGSGGGDVDCAARELRPGWPLRLRGWQLCQALWYDVTATYYVLVRGEETLAVDVLDDPMGVGRYRFQTTDISAGDEPGSLVPAADRAAYLTLKRIKKDISDSRSWEETKALAARDPARYRARLVDAVGHEAASEIVGEVMSGRMAGSDSFARWRRALRTTRTLGTRRRVFRARRSASRVVQRVLHPTGFVVLVVGPDGSGKSTLAEALPEMCGQLFRRSERLHFRGGILPRPGSLVRRAPSDTSRPHGREPYGRAVSMALLSYHWLDTLLGHAFKVTPTRVRTGLVVIERGFVDISIDPTRYRLNVPSRLVRGLSRLLPRADLTILLEADASVIEARKAELSRVEIDRQLDAWRSILRGSDVVRVDSSRPSSEVLEEIRGMIVERLERRTAATIQGGWAALPSAANPRLYAPRKPTAAALAALRLEAPSKTSSRLGLSLARGAIACGALKGFKATAPPVDVRHLLAPYIPPGGTIAVKRAIHHGRYIAAIIDRNGAPIALAKVATDDLGRSRLMAEKSAIEERAAPLLRPPLRAPEILAADDHVLLFGWVPYELRRHPWLLPPTVARGLGAFFAAGSTGDESAPRGPAHGDMAPWNALHAGNDWVLVDWEVSLGDAPPFFDVFHYAVQSHVLLGRPRRDELMRGLDGLGWVGEAVTAYAEGAGLPLSLVAPSFDVYLEHTSSAPTMRDMGPRSIQFRQDVRSEIHT